MTVEIYSTPGSGASTRFTATVGGTSSFVYGCTATAGFKTAVWAQGASVEQSWLKFGSDATTEVRISRTSSQAIRSAVVYPKDKGVTQSIEAGVLVLQVPPNVRLRIECDDDRANAMHVFSVPLKKPLPPTYTNFTTLTAKTVSTISTGTGIWTTATPHGLSSGDAILVATTGTMPALAGSTHVAAGAMDPLTAYRVDVASPTTFALQDYWGDAGVNLTSAGSGTITIKQASWSNTTTALYFGAGLHTIGRLFRVGSNVTIYVDGGAVLKGSFDLRASQGVKIQGRGHIDGSYATRAQALASPDETEYSAFFGFNGTTFGYSNTVEGLTVFNTPYYLTNEGVNTWTDCQVISPWQYNCDGFDCSEGPDNNGSVTRCFALVGDDGVRMESLWFSMTVTDTFFVCTNGAPLMLNYWGSPDQGNEQRVIDCDAMTLSTWDGTGGSGAQGANAIIKGWLDTAIGSESDGQFHVTIDGLKVWGPVNTRLFSLKNFLYPFGGLARNARGQFSDWTISDLTCEETPYQISELQGYDATSTPHDMVFTGITIGGVEVNESNWSTYVDQNSYPYNITLDSDDTLVLVPETGSGLAAANTYCSLSDANAYHLANGSPTAWTSATDAQKNAALVEATRKLDERYGRTWSGYRGSTTQALGWPRLGATDAEGWLYESNELPEALVNATAHAALLVLQGSELVPDTLTDAPVRSESITSASGASRTLNFAGARRPETQFPALDRMLYSRGLIELATGWGVVDL